MLLKLCPLHNFSIVLPLWCFAFVCTFYVLVFTSTCGKAICDSPWTIFLFFLFKGTCRIQKALLLATLVVV